MLGGCGGTDTSDGARPRIESTAFVLSFETYWVGRSFEGLALVDDAGDSQRSVSFAYGTCTPPSGEGGCAAPLTIESSSLCDRNPLRIDLRPRATRRVRGAAVRDYGEGRLELAAGDTNVVVWARPALGERALNALRRPLSSRPPKRLPRARYPRAYVHELRAVRDTYVRRGTIRGVRDELGISQRSVRFRLALARELGHRRLRRPDAGFRSNGRCAVEPSP